MSFALEWLLVASIIAAMTIANALVLALFMVPQSGSGYVGLQVLATVAAYPLVAAVCHLVFNVRRVAPGQVEGLGSRS